MATVDDTAIEQSTADRESDKAATETTREHDSPATATEKEEEAKNGVEKEEEASEEVEKEEEAKEKVEKDDIEPKEEKPVTPLPEEATETVTEKETVTEQEPAKIESETTAPNEQEPTKDEPTDTSTAELQPTTTSGDDTTADTATDTKGPSSQQAEQQQQQSGDSKSHSRTSSREAEGDKRSLSSQKRKERRKKKRASVPKLRRRNSSKFGSVAEQYLQNILFPYFQTQDPLGTGLLNLDIVLQVLYLPELNLQLTEEDLPLLQSVIEYDEQQFVDYTALAATAHRIITYVYTQRPETQANWVELQGIDGTKVMYNKKSGEVIDHAEDGMDLFEATIKDLFQSADTEGKNAIRKETLIEILKGKVDLSKDHIDELKQLLPDGDINYDQFQSFGREVVLKVYQASDQSDSEWIYLTSPQVGGFYLNKITGETKRNIGLSEGREQEAAIIEEAYTQINSLTMELDQERAKNKELENQIAQYNENLEEAVAQLDETGRQLDIANMDLQAKEDEIFNLQAMVAKGAEASTLEVELQKLQAELMEAYRTLHDKETRLGAQEQTIQDLSMNVDSVIDELKNAHGVIDARDSSINSLQYNLTNEQGRVKELREQMPSLETRLSSIVTEMNTTQRNLEEKSSQLQHTRKQLKVARERNTELEKRMETLEQSKDKLSISENENRTLKTFLTTKTAMIERRKREIQELREKLSEMEARDNRRAIILADVLEKTARAYQHQLHHQPTTSTSGQPGKELRPTSAPAVQLMEEIFDYQEDPLSASYDFAKPYTVPEPARRDHHTAATAHQKKSPIKKRRQHIKFQTVPRLPPIQRPKPEFGFVTNLELKQKHRKSDTAVTKNTAVTCDCEVCTANRGEAKKPEYLVNLAGKSGIERLKMETDHQEEDLAKQVKIGQRVIVQIKKSMYDLEPQKLTGVVKFVGKVDSEYVNNRVYVGVKLDEPAGNTDGLYKGKRYFHCLPNHGRMLPITSVLAVMPRQGIVYKPLQFAAGQKSSPYGQPRMHASQFQIS